MGAVNCILCGSANTSLREKLNRDELLQLYSKRAHVNTSRFFKEQELELYSCKSCSVSFYRPAIAGDGLFYDELQKYSGYYLETKAEFAKAAGYISANSNVLEIGCGDGTFASSINYASYTGLEFSSKAIKKAQEKGLHVLNTSIEEYAQHNSGKHDVVCCFQVLEHVPNPRSFIEASLKCVRENGLFILAVPSEDSFIKDSPNFYLNMPPHHITRWPNRTFHFIAGLYNLKLETVYHEPLNRRHELFFLKTKIYTFLIRFTGLNRKSIDLRIGSIIIYIAASFAAIIIRPFFLPKATTGQSVLVVYRKGALI
jgi:2-polyprenyl-3-methyl-5-hydroxy-6-metoxy-1,4-benzoquinol methylase